MLDCLTFFFHSQCFPSVSVSFYKCGSLRSFLVPLFDEGVNVFNLRVYHFNSVALSIPLLSGLMNPLALSIPFTLVLLSVLFSLCLLYAATDASALPVWPVASIALCIFSCSFF